MLSVAKNAGHALAEEITKEVLKRPEPTFQSYRREVDHRIGNDETDISLGRGVTMTVIQEPGSCTKPCQKNTRQENFSPKMLEDPL